MHSSEPLTESGLPSRTRPGNWQRIKSSAPPDSVIAADGGFGPMISDESAEEDEPGHTDERVISERGEAEEDEIVHDEPPKAEFDDFEAGSDDEDFGDFDEGVQAEEEEERGETSVHIINSAPPVESRWVSPDHLISLLVPSHLPARSKSDTRYA